MILLFLQVFKDKTTHCLLDVVALSPYLLDVKM